ncbi:MAG: hypothetical protein KIH89_002715 [Candidatus Shapirobacteria bacterium]|nr:hypothetical protein [Candidatus Shapirobacteria bacterium]
MHFNCRSFIGKNTPQFWSQTWENEPDVPVESIHLFGLISLQTQNDSLDLKTLGRELINNLNQKFFLQSEKDINQRLFEIINSCIADSFPQEVNVNLSLLANHHQQVYAATYGQNQIFLQRQQNISQLLSGLPCQVSQISGPVKNNDRLFLSTSDFVSKITLEKIKLTLTDPKIQNIEETFLSYLYSVENQNNLAAFLIETHSDEPADTSESNPVSSPLIKTPIISSPPAEPTTPPVTPLIISPPLSQPEVYVKSRFKFKISNHKKIQLLVALFLLIGLLISSYFGYQKNQVQKAETSFQNLKSELEKKLNNITAIKNLDPETTYQSAKEAKEIVSQMSQLNIHINEINQYKSQVDLILSQNGDSDSFQPESVYDTSLITNNPQFSKIIFSKSGLYLLDSTTGRIDNILPKEKSTKSILISDQIKSSSKILVDNNNLYLLSQGRISLIEKSGLTQKIDLSSSSVNITDAHFWNSSLYVLDKNSQTIWKSTPSASGYSTPQSWLKNDAKLELGANSLTIDGQIWVLTESGRIFLYNSGIKGKFNQNQEINFTKATNLVTDVDSDFLVFSDNSKFIYVYKKTGEFVSKFNLGNLEVLDVTFDASNKIIYFLASNQKIYKISL